MVSSKGARVLAAALVTVLGQLLLSSVPTFIGSAAPRGSHQLRLASGRQQEFQGGRVTAQFFKKMLNRKKQASVPEILHTLVAEPIAADEQPVEAAVNLKIDDAVPSQQVEPVVNFKIDAAVPSQELEAVVNLKIGDTALGAAVAESTREATMDDLSFKVADVESPVTSLLKTDDAIYDFFVALTDRVEALWNTRTAMANNLYYVATPRPVA